MTHQNTSPIESRHEADKLMLVAVSGGSDSIGLLHWLMENQPGLKLHVATIDHGLRQASAAEAQFVKVQCQYLGLPHTISKWENVSSASSAVAREARYNLLAQTAHQVGAPTIALGHTLDDQAETLVMRSLRMKPTSGTRGLSGMSEWATFNRVRLWRPLLGLKREQLRSRLRALGIAWIDDPTNENTSYERVRVRAALAGRSSELPDADNLARLGGASARTRLWMNNLVALHISRDVRMVGANHYEYLPDSRAASKIVQEILMWLILVCGGLAYRSPVEKIMPFFQATRSCRSATMTLGRCLLKTRNGKISVQREGRTLPKETKHLGVGAKHDDRPLITSDPQKSKATVPLCSTTGPAIAALENFRPQEDDCVYEAILDLLATVPRSA